MWLRDELFNDINMKRPLLLIIAFNLLLSGCAATNYHPIEQNTVATKPRQKQTVLVTNPEHMAFPIIKKSGIYNISTAPDTKTTLTIKEYTPLPSCGLSSLVTLYSLGLLQNTASMEHTLIYAIKQGNTEKLYQHDIRYKATQSLWQIPIKPFAKSEEDVAAHALAHSKRQDAETFYLDTK